MKKRPHPRKSTDSTLPLSVPVPISAALPHFNLSSSSIPNYPHLLLQQQPQTNLSVVPPPPKRAKHSRKSHHDSSLSSASSRSDTIPAWLNEAASAFVDATPPLNWTGGFYSWGTWLEQLRSSSLWTCLSNSSNNGSNKQQQHEEPPWSALIGACRASGQVCGTAALYRAKSDLVFAIINIVYRRGEQQRIAAPQGTQQPASERDIMRRVRAVVTRQRRHEAVALTLIRFLDFAFVFSAYRDCRLVMHNTTNNNRSSSSTNSSSKSNVNVTNALSSTLNRHNEVSTSMKSSITMTTTTITTASSSCNVNTKISNNVDDSNSDDVHIQIERELLFFQSKPNALDIRSITTRMQTYMWQNRWLPWYEQIPRVRRHMMIHAREAALSFCDGLPFPELQVRAGVRGLSRDHLSGAGSMNEWLLSLFHPRFVTKWALLFKVYEIALKDGRQEEERLMEETSRRVVERVLEPLTEMNDVIVDPTHSKLIDAAPGIVVTQSVRIPGRFTFRQVLELYIHLAMFGQYLHARFYGCALPPIEHIHSGIVLFEEIRSRVLEVRTLLKADRVDKLYDWCLATPQSHPRDGHNTLADYGGCVAYQHAAILAALGPSITLVPGRRKFNDSAVTLPGVASAGTSSAGGSGSAGTMNGGINVVNTNGNTSNNNDTNNNNNNSTADGNMNSNTIGNGSNPSGYSNLLNVSPDDNVLGPATENDPILFATTIAQWDAPLAARVLDASIRIGRSARNRFQNGKGGGLDLYTHRRVVVCQAALNRFPNDLKSAVRVMSRLHPVWDVCLSDKGIGAFDGRGARQLKLAVDKGNFEAAATFGMLLCAPDWHERRSLCDLEIDIDTGIAYICKAVAVGDTAAAADLLHLLRVCRIQEDMDEDVVIENGNENMNVNGDGDESENDLASGGAKGNDDRDSDRGGGTSQEKKNSDVNGTNIISHRNCNGNESKVHANTEIDKSQHEENLQQGQQLKKSRQIRKQKRPCIVDGRLIVSKSMVADCVQCLRSAAATEHSLSLFLGYLYSQGAPGVVPNCVAAVREYERVLMASSTTTKYRVYAANNLAVLASFMKVRGKELVGERDCERDARDRDKPDTRIMLSSNHSTPHTYQHQQFFLQHSNNKTATALSMGNSHVTGSSSVTTTAVEKLQQQQQQKQVQHQHMQYLFHTAAHSHTQMPQYRQTQAQIKAQSQSLKTEHSQTKQQEQVHLPPLPQQQHLSHDTTILPAVDEMGVLELFRLAQRAGLRKAVSNQAAVMLCQGDGKGHQGVNEGFSVTRQLYEQAFHDPEGDAPVTVIQKDQAYGMLRFVMLNVHREQKERFWNDLQSSGMKLEQYGKIILEESLPFMLAADGNSQLIGTMC